MNSTAPMEKFLKNFNSNQNQSFKQGLIDTLKEIIPSVKSIEVKFIAKWSEFSVLKINGVDWWRGDRSNSDSFYSSLVEMDLKEDEFFFIADLIFELEVFKGLLNELGENAIFNLQPSENKERA